MWLAVATATLDTISCQEGLVNAESVHHGSPAPRRRAHVGFVRATATSAWPLVFMPCLRLLRRRPRRPWHGGDGVQVLVKH